MKAKIDLNIASPPTPALLLTFVVALVLILPPAALAGNGPGGLVPESSGPPASGSGAHANIRHTPGESAEFSVAATNGYTLEVKSEKGLVTIVASRGRPAVPTISPSGRLLPANAGDVAESVYAVRSTSREPGVIRADLGPLGSIAVAFHPSGRERVTNVDLEDKTERCIGAAKVVRRLGTFSGNISFHAENGYAAAELGSARGTLGTSAYRNCTTLNRRQVLGATAPGLPGAALNLQGRAGTSSFFAFVDAARSSFSATEAERLSDDLVVLRRAHATASPSAFSFDSGATEATLRPPAPFAGRASYSAGDRGPATWTGGLNVQFPGLQVPLTGPAFDPPKLRLLAGSSPGSAR